MIQTAVQFLILALLLIAVPFLAGGLIVRAGGEGVHPLFRWVGGQMLLWAGFQLICVPLILWECRFELVVSLFLGYMLALLLLAAVGGRMARRKMAGEAPGQAPGGRLPLWKRFSPPADEERRMSSSGRLLLWGIFFGLLLFQLVQSVRLAYGETDDAYYLSVATATQSAGTMYQIEPYTGLSTTLDIRHILAPFPIWIAFLARLSGMRTLLLAKSVLPSVLICMAYAIFYLLGREIFPKKGRQRALFMIMAQLLVLFGDSSIYTVENFMIARSRQGKAALGSIVIPFLLLLLLLLMKKLQERERIPCALYLLLLAAVTAGCLCSALSALLLCMMTGIAGLLGAACYKQFRILPALVLCCVPCVGYAALYLLL